MLFSYLNVFMESGKDILFSVRVLGNYFLYCLQFRFLHKNITFKFSFTVITKLAFSASKKIIRISGHFQYPADYRILKLSGYRLSGWFLTPDIRLFGRISGYPAKYPVIRPNIRLSGLISGNLPDIRYPAKKVSGPTVTIMHTGCNLRNILLVLSNLCEWQYCILVNT